MFFVVVGTSSWKCFLWNSIYQAKSPAVNFIPKSIVVYNLGKWTNKKTLFVMGLVKVYGLHQKITTPSHHKPPLFGWAASCFSRSAIARLITVSTAPMRIIDVDYWNPIRHILHRHNQPTLSEHLIVFTQVKSGLKVIYATESAANNGRATQFSPTQKNYIYRAKKTKQHWWPYTCIPQDHIYYDYAGTWKYSIKNKLNFLYISTGAVVDLYYYY